jgi:hypothetical protein
MGRKDGAQIWVAVTGALVRCPDGRPDFFISTIENITKAKECGWASTPRSAAASTWAARGSGRRRWVKRAKHLMIKDGLSADDAAKVLGVSRRTLFRGLQAAREHDAAMAS